ncbi:Uncharacterised protein [Cedecea neteri]|nr:Uncharacterised protein [Cedecea neteri]
MMRVGDLPRRDVPVVTHGDPQLADVSPRALVLDAEGRPQHWQENGQRLAVHIAQESESLRHVYSALLDVPQGVLVRVTAEGHYAGTVDSALLSDALNRHQELHRND